MLVTCSIGRTSHQSLILYTVARLDTRWRDIEDSNGLPVTVSFSDSSSLSSASRDLIWRAFPFPFPLFRGLNLLRGFPLNLPFDNLRFCRFLLGLGQSAIRCPVFPHP